MDGHLPVEVMSKNMGWNMHFKAIYPYILKLIEFQCLGCLCILYNLYTKYGTMF